jgi:3-oxoacyl-(acyl-carrier-protein) synthase
MGVATALECLKQAGIKNPDAIITGTAFGCLADTGIFLTSIIEREGEMLPPTPFIQSTHNTVGGQIALVLQCHGYNNNFVHRGFSFENALLDAMLLLQENEAGNVLVGSVDEITDISHTIMTRFGYYKHLPVSNLALFSSDSKGTIAGEGAAFFLLTSRPSGDALASLDGLTTFYKPKDAKEIEHHIRSFLNSQSINIEDIDLVITGNNGDHKGDTIYKQVRQSVFSNRAFIHFKDCCGEYPTAASFALWLACNIIRAGNVPAAIPFEDLKKDSVKKILIYNHYQGIHHSLLLISAI